MVKFCLRNQSSFAIVAVLPEGTTDPEGMFPFANVGIVVNIIDADVETIGLMKIRCLGQRRIKVESFIQQDDGLFVGKVIDIPNDIDLPVPGDLRITSEIMRQLLDKLIAQNTSPDKLPVKPYRLEDTAWVANRWVELLDLPLLEKQRLMQLESPVVRLELIQDILTTGNLKTT